MLQNAVAVSGANASAATKLNAAQSMAALNAVKSSRAELERLRLDLVAARESGDAGAVDAIAERLMAMDERQSKMLQVIGAATGDASVVSEEDEAWSTASAEVNLSQLRQLDAERVNTMSHLDRMVTQQAFDKTEAMRKLAALNAKEQELRALKQKLDGLLESQATLTRSRSSASVVLAEVKAATGMTSTTAKTNNAGARAASTDLFLNMTRASGKPPLMPRAVSQASMLVGKSPATNSSASSAPAALTLPAYDASQMSFESYIDSLEPAQCAQLMGNLTKRRDHLLSIKNHMELLKQQGRIHELMEEDDEQTQEVEDAEMGSPEPVIERQVTVEVDDTADDVGDVGDDEETPAKFDDLESMLRRLDLLSAEQNDLRNARVVDEVPVKSVTVAPVASAAAKKASTVTPAVAAASLVMDVEDSRLGQDIAKLETLAASVENNITTLSAYLEELATLRSAVGNGDHTQVDSLITGLTTQLQQAFEFRNRIHMLMANLQNVVQAREEKSTSAPAVASIAEVEESAPSTLEALIRKIEFSDELTPAEKLAFIEQLYESEAANAPTEPSSPAKDATTVVTSSPQKTEQFDPQASFGITDETSSVLDVVAGFVASNDSNGVYMLSLFQKLKEVDRLGLRDQLLGIMDFLIADGTSAFEKTAENVNEDEEKDASEEDDQQEEENEHVQERAKEMPVTELDLANFITLLTNAGSEEKFTSTLLDRLKGIVVNMVKLSRKAQDPAFVAAFEQVLSDTLSMYLGESVAAHRSLLLRDVNGLLYDVVLDDDQKEAEDAYGREELAEDELDEDSDEGIEDSEEDIDEGIEDSEEDEMEEPETVSTSAVTPASTGKPDVVTFESSLQWKEVVEDDAKADESISSSPEKNASRIAAANKNKIEQLFNALFPSKDGYVNTAMARDTEEQKYASATIQEIMDLIDNQQQL